MNKPSTIWIIAALCVTIVLTAFGVITNRMIQKELHHSQQIVDAHRQGRIRLAMWRLDTLAASIIANEDDRSVFEFKNPELNAITAPDPALSVNPLYYRTPETTNLYWNLEPNNRDNLSSPQVYNESYLKGNNIATNKNKQNRIQLKELKEILAAKNDVAPFTNEMMSCQAAHVSLNNWDANANSLQAGNLEQDFSYNTYSQGNGSAQKIEEIITEPTEQKKLSIADKDSRLKAVNRMKGSRKTDSWNDNVQETKEKISKETHLKKEAPQAIKAPKSATLNTPIPESQPQQPLPEIIPPLLTQQYNQQDEPFSTPFTPIWLNDELMLVRKTTEPAQDSVQGVWLNKDVIITKLLAEIHDLFPHARLIPVKQDITKLVKGEVTKANESTMLSIPLMLIHNDLELVQSTPTDYILGPIGLAWLGAILAIGACYYMLKSVLKMAERRASFVSSITHELRTPLTTFRLYSDLLSSGIVKDPEKQQNYLNTLKLESERLSHLVENVLSYSQIERSNAKAKVESISLFQLIQRIEPRLNERATEDNMIVNTVYSESSAEEVLEIDTTGVEQIIFNLVDNACKYASAESHGREITLLAEVTNRKINLKICDQGDGIARSEQKRLFKPFHKSAKEAAHSKPGVGLGLALCKRLAKAMNGDLTISKNTNTKGACFHFSLPR